VLGGTSLSGGRVTIWGTIVGALVIGVLVTDWFYSGFKNFGKR
jgi:ribose/xylose/arabinose/galactoside ABC-type transport system permease subunit